MPATDKPEVRTVAVIGAGISGVTAAAHLLREGLQVKLFERATVSGGIWHFDPRLPEDPTYPSYLPSVGDYHTTRPGQFGLVDAPPTPPHETEKKHHPLLGKDAAALETHFAPPSPAYAGLTNNVPTNLMVSSLSPWPAGTPSNISQDKIEAYVQALSRDHGVDEVAEYSTRVEEIRKSPDGKGWVIRTLKLHFAEEKGERPKFEEQTRSFDAVVVATGHYNLPHVPDIPGLKEWKEAFPEGVIHSKQYREPSPFKGKTVFILGSGVSSMDISRELGDVAKKVYQSSRGGPYDLPANLLPANGHRVGAIASFEIDQHGDGTGSVVLENGERVSGIDQIILGTGYIKSYPFLPDLHDDTLSAADAGPRVLITADGQMTHNLHKDLFYIEDPTLAFVGVPYHTATFSLFDHQSRAVARALSGKTQLPSQEDMRAEYNQRIKNKGLGREFHSLGGDAAELNYVKDLVDWINAGSGEKVEGHSEAWIKGYWEMKEQIKAIKAGQSTKWFDNKPETLTSGLSSRKRQVASARKVAI